MCITTGRLGFGQVKQPNRDVAQPGSALAWGARGRVFESLRPDQIDQQKGQLRYELAFLFSTFVLDPLALSVTGKHRRRMLLVCTPRSRIHAERYAWRCCR